MSALATSPLSIPGLANAVATDGPEAVLARLGRFVLVGELADDEPPGWQFATATMVAPNLTDELGAGFDFDRGIVHPLVKRTSTFPHVILLGRASSNDVQIEHHSVSKLHARIRLRDEGFELEDAGSRNGTWVDGEKVDERLAVQPGVKLRFGRVELIVHEASRFVDVLRRIGPV